MKIARLTVLYGTELEDYLVTDKDKFINKYTFCCTNIYLDLNGWFVAELRDGSVWKVNSRFVIEYQEV
jgi:hypothetical protein